MRLYGITGVDYVFSFPRPSWKKVLNLKPALVTMRSLFGLRIIRDPRPSYVACRCQVSLKSLELIFYGVKRLNTD